MGKNPTFRWGKAALTGLKGAALAGLAAAAVVAKDKDVTVEDLQAAFVAGVLGFLFETGRNWAKNS